MIWILSFKRRKIIIVYFVISILFYKFLVVNYRSSFFGSIIDLSMFCLNLLTLMSWSVLIFFNKIEMLYIFNYTSRAFEALILNEGSFCRS